MTGMRKMVTTGRLMMLAGAGVAGTIAGTATALLRRRRHNQWYPVREGDGYVTNRTVTVDRPAEQIIDFWSDADRLAIILERPVALSRVDESRWRATVSPTGPGVICHAEILSEESGRVVRWQLDGPAGHEGRLTLAPAPGGRGTELRVELRYPQDRLDRAAAVFGRNNPDRMLRTALRRAKSLLECGVVVSTMDEPSARGPAQERLTRTIRETLTIGGRP